MPEALKNLYNTSLVENLCAAVKIEYSSFDSQSFTNSIFDSEWKVRELKARMRHIAETLEIFLPDNYADAITILKPVSEKFRGFEYMFFQDFVEIKGLSHFEESVLALEHFTKYSSSEFAVRPMIVKYGERMMAQMQCWAKSDNRHVRRLASEGCRPRLPWAMALPEFKNNPAPVMKILYSLKNDSSEYVRRSVANNLNDISKDNPDVVIATAQAWLGDNKGKDWIVKHACRSLFKQGNQQIMDLFGYKKPDHVSVESFGVQGPVTIGEYLEFSLTVKTSRKSLGKLRLEYAIDFVKKNGERSAKVFKISEADVEEQIKHIKKRHSFKIISTRVYYPGKHSIAVIINGHEKARAEFDLL